MKLNGKTALVTGGASWIGLAIVKLFEKEWAKVYCLDINEEAGKNIENENIIFYKLDVTKEAEWENIFGSVGKVDILINNAGIIWPKHQNPENIDLETWDLVHKINLTSVVLGCKYAIKSMKKFDIKWSIVNMSSRSWVVWVPDLSAYASSKSAIKNYSKSVALYAQKEKLWIRCNSLLPASIMTPMWENIIETGKRTEEELAFNIPMKRFGKAEEVANACLFLASDDSSYITWSEINIDWWILAWTESSPWV